MAVLASPPRLLLCALAILFCLDRSSAFSSSCSLPLAHVKRHYFCLREGSAAGALPVFHRAIRRRSSTVRSGARSELAMIVDKFFGNKASGKGKPQDVNKYGERFDQMLDSVQGYGEAEILLVENERLRTILRGIVEGAKEPPLRNAFKVLYEDLAPVRLGGDMLFSVVLEGLSSSVASAPEAARKMPLEQLALARELFSAADADGSGRIDRDELRSFLSALEAEGIAGGETGATQALAFQGTAGQSITFADFAAKAGEVLAWDKARSGRLQERLRVEGGKAGKSGGSSGKAKYEARFQQMMEDVVAWGGKFDPDAIDARRAAIIEGCVVGAGVPSVAQALRVIYVDYAPLRFVGDIIFKIVRSAIGN